MKKVSVIKKNNYTLQFDQSSDICLYLIDPTDDLLSAYHDTNVIEVCEIDYTARELIGRILTHPLIQNNGEHYILNIYDSFEEESFHKEFDIVLNQLKQIYALPKVTLNYYKNLEQEKKNIRYERKIDLVTHSDEVYYSEFPVLLIEHNEINRNGLEIATMIAARGYGKGQIIINKTATFIQNKVERYNFISSLYGFPTRLAQTLPYGTKIQGLIPGSTIYSIDQTPLFDGDFNSINIFLSKNPDFFVKYYILQRYPTYVQSPKEIMLLKASTKQAMKDIRIIENYGYDQTPLKLALTVILQHMNLYRKKTRFNIIGLPYEFKEELANIVDILNTEVLHDRLVTIRTYTVDEHLSQNAETRVFRSTEIEVYRGLELASKNRGVKNILQIIDPALNTPETFLNIITNKNHQQYETHISFIDNLVFDEYSRLIIHILLAVPFTENGGIIITTTTQPVKETMNLISTRLQRRLQVNFIEASSNRVEFEENKIISYVKNNRQIYKLSGFFAKKFNVRDTFNFEMYITNLQQHTKNKRI